MGTEGFLNTVKEKIVELWNDYKRTKIGLVGLGLLAFLVILAIIPWFTLNPITYERWYMNPLWDLNPRLAPPEWINLFVDKKYTPKTVLDPVVIEPLYVYEAKRLGYPNPEALKGMFNGYAYVFKYHYKWDIPTKDIVVIIKGMNQSVKVGIDVKRPCQSGVNETHRYLENVIYDEYLPSKNGEIRIFFSGLKESESLLENLKYTLIANYDPNASLSEISTSTVDPIAILFSKAGPGMSLGKTEPLKGEYEFIVKIEGNLSKQPTTKIVIVGSCYGVLGTDKWGRDIFAGILWGTHIALIMGLTYAFAVTFIGLLYGTISGYFGGKIDSAMQRIVEIMYSIPAFAFVILLVYMFKTMYGGISVWVIIGVYIIFGWPYMSMVIRSMTMQIKSQPYIEAAKAVGASTSRILLRHVMPQMIPYSFAMMVLTIPNAIMIEAALNVLGLGNPWIPSWGRILASAIDEGTITAWWWYIPPGLMIALTGITFIFIGNALELTLNPRLKKT